MVARQYALPSPQSPGVTRLRRPAVAGLFYPDHPPQLLRTVQQLLGEPAEGKAVRVSS